MTRAAIIADIAALQTQVDAMSKALDKAAADLAALRESLAFLRGNRKAALAWGGLLLSLLGGGVGAAVNALVSNR
jgi:hypothetical protein